MITVKIGPVSPWVELDGLNSYAFDTQGHFDGLDHRDVPASDQNALKARLESGKATRSSESLAPSPQPIDHHRFFPAASWIASSSSLSEAHMV